MRIIKKYFGKLLFVVLFIAFATQNSFAADLFPWVRYIGGFQTTAGIGTGKLTLNATINEADYQNGDVWTSNVVGVETIFGAKVVLEDSAGLGATRTGDYSFNGDLLDPDDVTLSLVSPDDSYTYFTATLTDVTFTCDNLVPITCWLNEYLDANNQATLNLTNIILNTNDGLGGPGTGAYPSRYIDELALYLAGTNVSGLKMSLLVPPVTGFDFTGNSSGPITYGLIDGLQSLNQPPDADAGVTFDQSQCVALTCDVTLDGSASTDPDSTVTPTYNDIVSYEWYEGATLLGTGDVLTVALPHGFHEITLVVTDSAGETDSDTITVVVDAAELSFLEINKAYVKRDGKVKIRGKLALPAGVKLASVDSIGRGAVAISTLGTVIDENVDFTERANGLRWKYHANTYYGVKKFRISWSGEKFHYQNGQLLIRTYHIGENETELEIYSCQPISVEINGTTITIDENDIVTCSNSAVNIDGDDDGDSDHSDSDGGNTTDDSGDCSVSVTLPFTLTTDMTVNISGTVNDSVLVGDYFTSSVGKFKFFGRFDPAGSSLGSLSPKDMTFTVDLGGEGYTGTILIDEATWTKIKPRYWKYKSH